MGASGGGGVGGGESEATGGAGDQDGRHLASIAAAALDPFGARGDAAVTMAEVAAAARVGKRTLYRSFADKEDLLFAEDRGEVIASAPALSARGRAKHADWEAVLADGLCERGVSAGEARLLGRIAVACYDEA